MSDNPPELQIIIKVQPARDRSDVARWLTAVRRLLTRSLSDTQLRTLSSSLDIDYDKLPGSSRSTRARNLLAKAAESSKIDEVRRQIGALGKATERSAADEKARVYDALIYMSPGETLPAAPPSSLDGYPATLGALTLVGVEQVVVQWGSYQRYLDAFLLGQPVQKLMRGGLLQAISGRLEALFDTALIGRRRRIWFSSDVPEVDEIPWELLVYDLSPSENAEVSFVRGLPPDVAAPPIAIKQRMRLAIVHPQHEQSETLLRMFDGIPNVDVLWFDGPLRFALERALAEDPHALHLVVDGFVSPAWEGVLLPWAGAPSDDALAASDLSARLRGTSVGMLGLSAAEIAASVAGHQTTVPSAFRAFMHLGASQMPLPSVVAPAGPIGQAQLARFWPTLYASLAESLNLEQALTSARDAAQQPPMVTFLRAASGRIFRRYQHPERAATDQPAQLQTQLQLSQQLEAQIQTLGSTISLTPELNAIAGQERERQGKIQRELDDLCADAG